MRGYFTLITAALILSVTTEVPLTWVTKTCLVDGTYVQIVHLNGGHCVIEQLTEDLLVAVTRKATLDADLLVVSSCSQVNAGGDGRLACGIVPFIVAP